MQDNNAERRNLVVTSYAFIAVSIGDATMSKGVVTLSLISVEFQNIEYLVLLAWLTLFWFMFRYWLTHKGLFTTNLKKEVKKFDDDPLIRKYFRDRMGAEPLLKINHSSDDAESGYQLETLSTQSFKSGVGLVWRGATRVRRNEEGKIISTTGGPVTDENKNLLEKGVLVLNDFRGRWITLRLIIRCFYREESFSSYLVPYLLFIAAVILAMPITFELFFTK